MESKYYKTMESFVANIISGNISPRVWKELTENIRENIGNYQKISAKLYLNLKYSKKFEQIGNIKNIGKIGNIKINWIYLQH
jgi:hypothetical protein